VVLHVTRLRNTNICPGWEDLKRAEGLQKGGGAQTRWNVSEGYGPLVQIPSHAETDPMSWTEKAKT